MKKTLFYTLLIVCLSGCSSIYHPKDSYVPEGYFEQKISDTVFEISFESYQRESWGELEQYLLQRAEEIRVEYAFQSYAMSNYRKLERVEVVEVPARVMPEAMANCSGCAQSGLGLVSPAYQREYHIRTVIGIFEYN